MKTMFDMDDRGATFAAGMKTGFAAVLVAVLVALGLGLATTPAHEQGAPPEARAAAPGTEATVYFPSQYKLDAPSPEDHVQAF